MFGSERKASDGSKDVPNGIIRLLVTVILPLESIVILAVPLVDAEIVSAAGKNIPVLLSPDGVIDGALVLPADTVLTPDTTRLVAVAIPKVLIPETFNCCAVKLVALVTPKVLIPVIFKSVKVLGALAIADSIVAVVVASNEAMFWSCLAELMTCVALT